MKRFRFELETLLNLKRHWRDDARQVLAGFLRQSAELLLRRTERERCRQTQLDHLRQSTAGDELDIEASRSRRAYAGRLTNEINALDNEHAALTRQTEAARQMLLRADQEVRALELLSERREAAFTAARERQDTLETGESWRALAAVNRTSP
jgi:flagellar biosynthesis chaperone FliJ